MSQGNATDWLNFLASVVCQTTILIVACWLGQCFVEPVARRRFFWRLCLVGMLAIFASETTGFGRGVGGWARFKFWRAAVPPPVRNLSGTPQSVNQPVMGKPVLVHAAPVELSVKKEVANWQPGYLWLVGMVLVTGRMVGARLFMWIVQLRRTALQGKDLNRRVKGMLEQMRMRKRIRLLEVPGLGSPVAFGIFQPAVALPADFETRFTVMEQDVMLLHELAHLKSGDPTWYLLMDLLCGLLWWNPLIWWMRQRLHFLSELAADQASLLVPNGPETLAECLIRLGREMFTLRHWAWMNLRGNGFRSLLGMRVDRLLRLDLQRHPEPDGWRLHFIRWGGGLLLIGLIVFTAGWAQEPAAGAVSSCRSGIQLSWQKSPAFKYGAEQLPFLSKNTAVPAVPITKEEEMDALITEGQQLYEEGKYQEAARRFKRCKTLGSKDPLASIYIYYISCHDQTIFLRGNMPVDLKKNTDWSLAFYQQIQSEIEQVPLPKIELAGCTFNQALKILRDAMIKADPNHVGLHFLMSAKLKDRVITKYEVKAGALLAAHLEALSKSLPDPIFYSLRDNGVGFYDFFVSKNYVCDVGYHLKLERFNELCNQYTRTGTDAKGAHDFLVNAGVEIPEEDRGWTLNFFPPDDDTLWVDATLSQQVAIRKLLKKLDVLSDEPITDKGPRLTSAPAVVKLGGAYPLPSKK